LFEKRTGKLFFPFFFIWLLTGEVCHNKENFAVCRPLENFLEANYTVIETKDFYLERVRLLRKK